MSLDRTLAHPELQRLAASLEAMPGQATPPEEIGVWAAVAVIFRTVGQSVELLFIKRVERETDTWSGQVALPGGRRDPDDESLRSTAVRETWEEIGLDLATTGRDLGVLDDVAPRSPILPPIAVRPYVFSVSEECALVAGSEVAEAFWIPLDLLRDQRRWTETRVIAHGLNLDVEAIVYGEHVIWGMTHRIVQQIAERLAD